MHGGNDDEGGEKKLTLSNFDTLSCTERQSEIFDVQSRRNGTF